MISLVITIPFHCNLLEKVILFFVFWNPEHIAQRKATIVNWSLQIIIFHILHSLRILKENSSQIHNVYPSLPPFSVQTQVSGRHCTLANG